MKNKKLLALFALPLIFTGCMQSNEPELTPEEQEQTHLWTGLKTG